MTTLQVIGGGRMGLALVGGLLASGRADPADVVVVEPDPAQRAAIVARHPAATVLESPVADVDSVLSVKPWLAVPVAATLESPRRVISIAAGITVAELEAALPAGTPVIRAMPNTPALVGAGATAVAPGTSTSSDDLAWSVELLSAVGIVEVVAEQQIDAVTGLSGSGPAYLFLVAEAMTDAGVLVGLSREVAARLANQTLYGAGKMLVESTESTLELRSGVTTPGGTTAAGLAALEDRAVRAAFADAVRAATERSRRAGTPMTTFDTISFLSDFGTKDEFVGVVKSVIRGIVPSVAVIDITHEIEPHDLRAGGLTLARSVQYLAPGILLGIVDPGVGSSRKGVVIEVADGAAYLVGPDNGLLAPAVSMVGGATGAVVLDNPEYQLSALGSTFAGRDVFAPAAAHLCAGVPMHALGTPIDPSQLVPGVLPVSQTDADGAVSAEVLWVDRFGNLQLNVDPSELDGWGDAIEVVGGRTKRTAARVTHFAEVPTGTIGVMTDSYGLVALVVDRSSAAFELELEEGDAVTLRRSVGGASRTTAVTLGRTAPAQPPSFQNEEVACDPPS